MRIDIVLHHLTLRQDSGLGSVEQSEEGRASQASPPPSALSPPPPLICLSSTGSSTDSGGMAVTVKCNGRLQRSSRVVEEGELKRRNTMEEVEKLSTSVNTSAVSLISTSSVMGEVEGRRRG